MACQCREIAGVRRVGREEGVQAEAFRAERAQPPEPLRQLRAGEAVLGLARLTHDRIAEPERPARVVAAGDGARDAAMAAQEVDMRDVVQVDERVQLPRELKLLRRGIVAGKHDLVPGDAHRAREHQLRE